MINNHEIINNSYDSQFDVEHLKADLKARSVRGGAVTISGQFLFFILRTASIIVLARLLTPADFGLIAMVTAVTGFAALFKDLGLSMATIQKADINHDQITKLFWINVSVSVLLAIVTAVSAPIIAWFYGEPRLTMITLAMSLVFLFGGFTVQHYALIQRQMRFTALQINEIVSLCLSSGIGIISSALGAGYWALVLIPVVSALCKAIGVWWISDWRPGSPFVRVDIKNMLNFGMNLTGFNILNYFIKNLDNILIGKFWGAGQLGLYSKAYGLLVLPINQINVPIASVAIPSLSRLKNNSDEYAKYYYRAVSVIAFVALPAIMTLAAMSYEIIPIILGKQWTSAAPIFNVLAFAALAQTIVDPVQWVYVSLGQTERMVRWGLFSAPIVIIAFFIGLPWGAYGVAVSFTICSLTLLLFPCLWWAFRYSPLTISGWFRSIRCSVLVSLIMYIAVKSAHLWFMSASPFINILIYCGIALAIFIIINILWPEAREQTRSLFGLFFKYIIHKKTYARDEQDDLTINTPDSPGNQSYNVQQKAPCTNEHLKRPEVSIIIPTYNRAKYVSLAIDSVLRQTFTDYEIIVIDDGSTDGTKEHLKSYGNKIKYIYQDNSGVSSARNTGINSSCGKWIAFLDSDDEWGKDYLSKQIKMANKIPGLCAQITNCLFIGLNGENISYFEINSSINDFNGKDYMLHEEPFRYVVRHGPWQIGSTIILHDALRKAGLFDTSLKISEDYDLIARTALHGSFGMIREELVTIYRRDESIECLTDQAKNNLIQAKKSDARIFEKLAKIETLKYKERKTVIRLLGKNRRGIGNILQNNRDIKGARYYYKEAIFIDQSIASFSKYILSFLPARASLWLSNKKRFLSSVISSYYTPMKAKRASDRKKCSIEAPRRRAGG